MSINFKLDTRELEKAVRRLEKETDDKATEEILLGAGMVYAGHVKAKMHNSPASGNSYQVSATGNLHHASGPGEAPAVDTGNLVNSIRAAMKNKKVVRIGTAVFYALFLEFGTRFMQPRPFMRSTFDERAGELVEYITNQIKKRIT